MKDEFIAFLQEPTRVHFLRVRSLVMADASYAPYSRDFDALTALYDTEKYTEAQEKIRQMMPNWLLTPSLHWCASMIADRLDDQEHAEMEAFIAHQCLEGIRSTGDGSAKQPYLVTRIADEYDLLMTLDKKLSKQQLVHQHERHYDVLMCDDGSEIWFDITDSFGRASDGMLKQILGDQPLE